MAKQSNTPSDDRWKAGARDLFARMSPEGQERALATWAKIGFSPTLLSTPGQLDGVLADITVLDLEFQHDPATLLEVAAVRYRNGQEVGRLVSFVQFFGEIDWRVANLTGITRADLRHAPTEKQVLQALFRLAEDLLFVCHNIGADRTQLEKARKRHGKEIPLANDWLCTMALARKRRPKGAKNGLGELCREFGIASHDAHRALRDVEMCFEVLKHFHEREPVTAEHLAGAGKRPAATQTTLFTAAA